MQLSQWTRSWAFLQSSNASSARWSCIVAASGLSNVDHKAIITIRRTRMYGHEYVQARRYASSKAAVRNDSTSVLRNVSFWGHIDAGKTTLTEKVLYLANALVPPDPSTQNLASSSRMLPGDVDSGSTVTDYLEAERQRGITIQSAAVGPFTWTSKANDEKERNGQIMLIDTPGHIDFTIEVERSLRVADGCVVLIDGVEGVESQTEGVWRIAQRYNVRSHVAFINKLDRTGSSISQSIRSIVRAGMHARPTLLQLPIFEKSTSQASSSMDQEPLVGLIDLTSSPLVAHFYGGKAGEDVTSTTLDQALAQGKVSKEIFNNAKSARAHLVENLANLDEEMMEQTLSAMEQEESNDEQETSYTDAIDATNVRQAIRRLVIRGEILPVLCGSAAKGVGVQPVLDAIVDYLPSPTEAGESDASEARGQKSGCVWGLVRKGVDNKQALRQLQQQQKRKQSAPTAVQQEHQQQTQQEARVSISLSDPTLSLLAFKVVWDKRKGPMTFVRVYSGTLTRASTLLNTKTGVRERLSKILFVYADRHVETDKLEAGQIGVLLGFRDTRTGDTLVEAKAATTTSGKRRSKENQDWAASASTLALRRVNVPPPVFSMSIEPLSKSDEGALREALDMLIRTDPSLHLDQESSAGGGGAGASSSGGLGSVAASSGGQMVLSGMGELHLEIARDRLLNEFNARAHLGDVRVSYRETTINDSGDNTLTVLDNQLLEREVMGTMLKAGCRVALRNLTEGEEGDPQLGGNTITIDISRQASEDLGQESQDVDVADGSENAATSSSFDDEVVRRALQSGLLSALSRGPLSGNPITGVHVHLDAIKSFGATLSPAKAFHLLAVTVLREAVKVRGAELMEPFMNVRIQCDDNSLGKIVSNLTSEQNGMVEHVDHALSDSEKDAATSSAAAMSSDVYLPPTSISEGIGGGGDGGLGHGQGGEEKAAKCTIQAVVPLAHLVRYSTTLRALSRGTATYEMSFRGFAVVPPERQRMILSNLGKL